MAQTLETSPLIQSPSRQTSTDTLRAMSGVFFAQPNDVDNQEMEVEPDLSAQTTPRLAPGQLGQPSQPGQPPTPMYLGQSMPPYPLYPSRSASERRSRDYMQHLPSLRSVFSCLGVTLLIFFLYLTVASTMHPPPTGPGRKPAWDMGVRRIFSETLNTR
jgi:hypothetical protein